jgi:hypothetical protein
MPDKICGSIPHDRRELGSGRGLGLDRIIDEGASRKRAEAKQDRRSAEHTCAVCRRAERQDCTS